MALPVRLPDGKVTRARFPANASTAEAVAMLVGSMAPLLFDLSGRLRAWYRLEAEGALLPADTRMGELPAETELILREVDNTVVLVEVEILRGEPPIRMRTPIGRALPARSLVGALESWLDLSLRGASLSYNDVELGPNDILADVAAGEGGGRLVLSLPAEEPPR